MELRDNTDHIAILSLMIVGVMTKRLNELGHIDESTAAKLHKQVRGVRLHAQSAGISDLEILFDNIDNALDQTVG
jgi:hypothetical protein